MKKLLALVLALVMTLSLCVTSNAAFADADKIEHDEAVEVMSALGVINGKPGGKFDPKGNVTRAEMAKMITIVTLGNVDVSAFVGTATDLTDINGHWAEGYIKYCYSQGIISGKGAGIFDPNANVTTAEAAKMLLVAIGYNATVQGYVGGEWTINVARDAQKSDFYEDLTVSANVAMTRDDAAQMIYNAIQAAAIGKTTTLDPVTGKVTYTYGEIAGTSLLRSTFGMLEAEGMLVADTYNATTKKYTYTIETGLAAPVANTAADQTTVTTKTDFTALEGLKVKVQYKKDNDGTLVAYGMHATCATVSASVGELAAVATSATKAELANVKYDLNNDYNDTDVYYNNRGVMADTNYNLNNVTADKASALTLVDTDKDGKYNYAVVAPVTVAKVTYVGAKGITAGGAYTFEGDVIEEGLAKNDFVKVTAAANTVYTGAKIEKIATVTGTVTGLKDTNTSAQIDGKWYKLAANNGDALALNKEFTLAVVGGYYYNATKNDGDANLENVVLALDKGTVSMGLQQAKFLTSAGEKVVKSVAKIGGNNVATTTNEVTDGTLYTFKEKDGNYELTAVSATNDLGYTYVADAGDYTKATTNPDVAAKIGAYEIDDDATIFVVSTNGTGTQKVITGKALNGWSSDVTIGTAAVLYKTVNGVKKVMVADIDLTAAVPAATGEVGNYAYVVSAPYQIKEGDDTYDTYEIWNGTEKVTVKDEDADLAIAKGNIIEYTDLGDGYIKGSDSVGAPVAVTGYTDKALQYVTANGTAGTATALTKDTVVLYVDSKEVAGVAGGAYELAAQQANGSRIMNAWVVGNASGALDLVVVEVNNDIEALANNNVDTTGAAGFTVADAAYNTAYTGWTIATDVDYAIAGDTVIVTLTSNGTGTQTSAAIAVTGVGATVASPVTLTASTARSYTVKITVGTANISAITVTLS